MAFLEVWKKIKRQGANSNIYGNPLTHRTKAEEGPSGRGY